MGLLLETCLSEEHLRENRKVKFGFLLVPTVKLRSKYKTV